MSIIDDLLATLPSPGPDVREVRIGAFWTAVVLEPAPFQKSALITGGSRIRTFPKIRGYYRCGLASALRDDDHHHHAHNPVREAGHLHERSARELAELARSESLLEASIGLATINALLDVDEDACVELNAEQVILEQGASRRVAVVGHFPFISRVREAAKQLWVLEKRPGEGDLPAEAASEIIPQANVVAITGTSLINHTFEELIELCCPEAFVLVLGPTTPLSPVLFDYGVDVISGTLVTEPETVLRYISQGASFRQVKRGKGVKLLTLARGTLRK